MIHDPMCWFADPAKTPAVAVNDGWPCICDIIARVREDERKKYETYSNARKVGREQGYSAALRDAVIAVYRSCGHTKYEGCAPCAHDDAAVDIEALGGER